MAKESRSVKQYRVYHLIEKVEGKVNNAGDPVILDKVIATFDDRVLLDAYVKGEAGSKLGQLVVQEEWTEVEPAAENFSTLFNPDANNQIAQSEEPAGKKVRANRKGSRRAR